MDRFIDLCYLRPCYLSAKFHSNSPLSHTGGAMALADRTETYSVMGSDENLLRLS